MARLPRLVLPGLAHCVIQRGHGARPVFAEEGDRSRYLAALRETAPACGVQVLAWALLEGEVLLLAVPSNANGLSQLMQAVGRRYVSAYNRRHGLAGTLWDGRFRCAPVEAGPGLLDLLVWVDGQDSHPGHTSATLRLAGRPDSLLTNPPEFWALGNTPFDREAAYRRRLAEGATPAQAQHWRQAALGGWAIGTPAFGDGLAANLQRPARPRAPGRPRKARAGDASEPAGGTPHA